eukprot:TRINITY_DN19263_c0_g3_i1.p1 TRINITY_DN19263_c0_g3~~TRINITY_DN19263_c0_g3_i1.p1  ORF type:complete len:541 (+),score=228.93 TRINITY_DN19263_c0_g3_i1:57-1625(+)
MGGRKRPARRDPPPPQRSAAKWGLAGGGVVVASVVAALYAALPGAGSEAPAAGGGECAGADGAVLADGSQAECGAEDAFVDWVRSAYRRKAARVSSPPWGDATMARFDYPSGSLRGLKAQRHVRPGDPVLMVPTDVCITAEESVRAAPLLRFKQQHPEPFAALSPKQVQAVRLCFEAGQGRKGRFAPWIAVMPHTFPQKMQWWSAGLHDALRPWPGYRVMRDRWAAMHVAPLQGAIGEYLRSSEAELRAAAEFEPRWGDAAELWHWAVSVLESRSFNDGMLVPLVDMANHHPDWPQLNKVILGPPPKVRSAPEPAPSYWAVWAHRSVRKGEEVFLSYSGAEEAGFSCDIDRLAKFGFAFGVVGAAEQYRCAEVSVPLPPELPQWRLHLLRGSIRESEGGRHVPVMLGRAKDGGAPTQLVMLLATTLIVHGTMGQRQMTSFLNAKQATMKPSDFDSDTLTAARRRLAAMAADSRALLADAAFAAGVMAAPGGSDVLPSVRVVAEGEATVLQEAVAALDKLLAA